MKNFVQIYENSRLIYEGYNMIVLTGRMFAQHVVTNCGAYKDWKFGFFGIGSGGVDPNNDLIPIAPRESDTDLYSPIQLGSNYPDSGRKKAITSATHVTNLQTVIELDVAATDGPPLFKYSEAGLFAADSLSNPTQFLMVARITFPAITKDASRSQKFFWYLFF
jgi:hypothetical protein